MRLEANMNNVRPITAGHHPAAATAAVVTIAAEADQCWGIKSIQFSYDTTPTNGRLTVVAGSTTLLDQDISAAGPGQFRWSPPLHNAFTKNEAMVVTLASGEGSVVGNLDVEYV